MGFWSTLGKIGLIAGGGIATAMTAGAASPLLAAAIGAGIGAGTGAGTAAIDHKSIWKGMATGAALGGISGGAGNLIKGAKTAKDALSVANIAKDTAIKGGVNAAGAALGGGDGSASEAFDAATSGAEGPYVQASDGGGSSILSALKQQGLQMVTDPKTGQISLQKILGAAGNTSGAVAEGMAAGRDKEVSNYAAVNNADILQRKTRADLMNNNYGNALRSALAMNIKDARYDNLPAGVNMVHMTGGARPSALGAEGALAARTMNKNAQAGLENPDSFAPLPDTKAGTLENTLGMAGTVAKGIGQIGVDQSQSYITDLVKQLLAKQQEQNAPQES